MNDPYYIWAMREGGPVEVQSFIETSEADAKRKRSMLRLQGYTVEISRE